MSLPVPKYHIGKRVFHVSTNTTAATYDCPDCQGSRKWQCKSPAGAEMEMDCPRCQRVDYGRSGGELSLTYTRHIPYVRVLTIGSVRIDTYDTKSPVSYMCHETGVGSGYVFDEAMLTADEAKNEAARRCAELQAENDARPAAVAKMATARLGYFDALRAAIAKEIEQDVRSRLKSEMKGDTSEDRRTPGILVGSGAEDDGGVYRFDLAVQDVGNPGYGGALTIADGYGGLCAGWATKEQGPANVAFMVKAWNAHDSLVAALTEIAKGEGRFSTDPLIHAGNTIEDMKTIAADALRKLEEA